MDSQSLSASSRLENGSGGRELDYQRQHLQAFTFGGTPRGSANSGNRFLSPDISLRSVSNALRSLTIALRGNQINTDTLYW